MYGTIPYHCFSSIGHQSRLIGIHTQPTCRSLLFIRFLWAPTATASCLVRLVAKRYVHYIMKNLLYTIRFLWMSLAGLTDLVASFSFSHRGSPGNVRLVHHLTWTSGAASSSSSSPPSKQSASISHEKWERMFAELKAFKAEHGHCLVPQNAGRLGR